MNTMLSELYKFLQHMGWEESDIKEDEKTININKKNCTDNIGSRLLSYNFDTLFDIFQDSFSILINTEESINNGYIKKDFNKESIKEYIEDTLDVYSYLNVEINISKRKLIECNFSNSMIFDNFKVFVYFKLQNFISHVDSFLISKLEDEVFYSNKKTIVIILSDDILLFNTSILIIGKKSKLEIEDIILKKFDSSINFNKYKKIVEMRNELCNWIDGTKWLCPESLFFDFDDEQFTYNEEFKQMLLKKCVDIIIPFISDFTSIDEITGNVYCNINGYKKIKITFIKLQDYNFSEVKYLYKLYEWVYGNNNSDRISILRNIVSIFLCGECNTTYYSLLLNKSAEIYKSVLNNFDIYLKENVKEYFEDRHKIKEMISNKSKDITNQIGALLENMNKNFITSAGVILVAIIGYITKADIQILKIAAIVYGLYIILNGAYYFPYYCFKVIEINNDYTEHIDTFRKTLISTDIPDDSMIRRTNSIFYIYWGGSIFISLVFVAISAWFAFGTSSFILIIQGILNL